MDLPRLEFLATLSDDKKLAQGLMQAATNDDAAVQRDCKVLFEKGRFDRWKYYTSPKAPDRGGYRLQPGPVGWPTFEMLMCALLERKCHQAG